MVYLNINNFYKKKLFLVKNLVLTLLKNEKI